MCRVFPPARLIAITEELYGHEFTASAISQINKTLDVNLKAFCGRRLSAHDWPGACHRYTAANAGSRLRGCERNFDGGCAELSPIRGWDEKATLDRTNSNTRNAVNDSAEVDTHCPHRRERVKMARYLYLSVAVSNAGMKSTP